MLPGAIEPRPIRALDEPGRTTPRPGSSGHPARDRWPDCLGPRRRLSIVPAAATVTFFRNCEHHPPKHCDSPVSRDSARIPVLAHSASPLPPRVPLDYPRALSFANALAAALARVLGDILDSVILHGSLALGDYEPGRSDIDVLAVVERPLTDGEIEVARAVVFRLASRAPTVVDLRVVTRAAAAAPTRAPAMELYVRARGSGTTTVETRVAGEPDLVVELSIAREIGRTLLGCDPATVIGTVPDGWVVQYSDELLAQWEHLTDDPKHAELMVLTACRIWRFTTEGTYCSKSAAARWAVERDPSLTAVAGALRRRNEPDATVEPAEIARLLSIVRSRIARRLLMIRSADPPSRHHDVSE